MRKQEFLYKLFAVIALVCFGLIVLRPLWDRSNASIDGCLYFVIGWSAATISGKLKE